MYGVWEFSSASESLIFDPHPINVVFLSSLRGLNNRLISNGTMYLRRGTMSLRQRSYTSRTAIQSRSTRDNVVCHLLNPFVDECYSYSVG